MEFLEIRQLDKIAIGAVKKAKELLLGMDSRKDRAIANQNYSSFLDGVRATLTTEETEETLKHLEKLYLSMDDFRRYTAQNLEDRGESYESLENLEYNLIDRL